MAIDKKLIDQLLTDYKKPEDIIGESGLLKELTKAILERALAAEMTDHLGYEKHDPAGHHRGNSIAATVVLVLLGRTALAFARFGKVESGFPLIQDGESRASVVARLGRPNYYEGKCGTLSAPYKDCSYEYIYSHPFAPWVPEYYVVAFADDSVIHTAVLSSP